MPKYISSGVCPWNAECGIFVLCSSTKNATSFWNASDGIERVEIEPLVLERPPPRLDDRVGPGHLDLSEDASELGRVQQRIDRGVDVLDAAVGHDGRRQVRGWKVLASSDQNGAGGGRLEALEQAPGEDLAGIVVDDGVQVGSEIGRASCRERVCVPV